MHINTINPPLDMNFPIKVAKFEPFEHKKKWSKRSNLATLMGKIMSNRVFIALESTKRQAKSLIENFLKIRVPNSYIDPTVHIFNIILITKFCMILLKIILK